jgi:hypothetical protein
MKIRMIAAVAALVLSAGAQAATVWSDNFDTAALGTDVTPAGWYLGAAGTGDVDVIGDPGFFDLIPGNGRYIDLDGSNGAAGFLTTDIANGAGVYTVSFQLGGNHRDGVSDDVTVNFGATSATYTIDPNAAFTTYTMSYTATGSTPFSLSFHDGRDGNVGALLDNVSISAVPEAGTLSMMLAGIAALGFAARRRRSA